ncbi:class I SAM-dependent methyltransferase [Priestia koreensis]|uniref:class I SAM-dependent methyltransferase n=1 Tax=Priestia koreensis TaxID=284581 RepID=UPI001F55BAEB|nr:class I SAM-dependent methyltransferase [Priestia koreensis]
MSEWKELIKDSQTRWEQNAEHWDNYMGEASNRFHQELICPYTEKLLGVKPGQTVLDIGCGNGNFSRRLAALGARVAAFDYSAKMIERAKGRSEADLNEIDYRVIDATNDDELSSLGTEAYDHAVANMALMDIADITPLAYALHTLLKANGTFVFSVAHPCFQSPGLKKIHETEDVDGQIITKNSIQLSTYLTPQPYQAIGIKGQTIPHYMFHRSLSYYMNIFFEAGFMLDGMEEPSFKKEKGEHRFEWLEIPPVVIFRFRKQLV